MDVARGRSVSELHKFMFEGGLVRGAVVRLDEAWAQWLARRAPAADGPGTHAHAWPPAVAQLVGELSAAAVLLQAAIRFDGQLSLQIAGDGPVRLALAEVQPDYRLRATASLAEGDIHALGDVGFAQLVNRTGRGRCALTLQARTAPAGQAPYQSLVPLVGDDGQALASVAEAVQAYLRASEQLDACLVLAAGPTAATGLMLQRMPGEGGHSSASTEQARAQFDHLATLARSLTPGELLSLDNATVLRRLFWQDGLRIVEACTDERAPRFACTCSRERVMRMIVGLGVEEARSIIDEQGAIQVHCEFCGIGYRFDAIDAEQLFTAGRNAPPAPAGLQ